MLLLFRYTLVMTVNDISAIEGNKENLDFLTHLVRETKIVPFLGTGFSIPACPGWGKFLDGFFECLKQEERILPDEEERYLQLQDGTQPGGFEAMADRLLQCGRRQFCDEKINRHFKTQPTPEMTQKFRLLHTVFPFLKITTNFDPLIENTSLAGQHVSVCRGNQSDELQRLFTRNQENALLKIHGTLTHVPAIVLASHQYQAIYGHPTDFDPNAEIRA